MKRIYFTAAALFAWMQSFSQSSNTDTGFVSRKLKLEEINFVSSYYQQNGDHSAVTGGIGTEKLSDLSNFIDVKLIRYDKKKRKHSFLLDLGVDHYTSASSDRIDLKANSSASHADTRVYPSFTWNEEDETNGKTIGAGVSLSKEFDYSSFGANLMFAKKTKNKMGEFAAKAQVYLDQVSLVTPVELRTESNSHYHEDYPVTPRNTFAASLSYAQIINSRLQVMFLADLVRQNGYLGLPFHRVYFADSTVHQEKMPDNRLKLPLGFRASYFVSSRIIVRAYYRYYTDSWELHANTIDLEVPVKISPFVSVSPFYRYYTQTAVKYFAGYHAHTAADGYYTSNYDLSKFNSQFVGAGIRLTPANGILGIQSLSMLELRYGHYFKTTGMNANIISLNLKIK
ncbi:DUF3570 domain-containing protein [Danxiaibacter flavus]|uniref:DUF3570 domain-containing protein n=1 Tax=Danxiaibacter flavus TaxID=3049108 RepID=A0ABV3ZLZ6_9BACT|nr:DUF3570 domain-containing protein [Chitinophagaceae bacterium DXS]